MILAVAEKFPETLVLVDEAYSDFAGRSLVSRMDEFPNLVISKTFSKVLAAAGLRVGTLIVHPDLMGYFTAAALPYNVSTLTLAVAARIARDEKSIGHRLELAKQERDRVLAALRKVPAIEVFPSVTNFILFRLKNEKPPDVHARFLEQSVLIRDISIWPGCDGVPAGLDRNAGGERSLHRRRSTPSSPPPPHADSRRDTSPRRGEPRVPRLPRPA